MNLSTLTSARPNFVVATVAFTLTGIVDAFCKLFGGFAMQCNDMFLATETLWVLIFLQGADVLTGILAARKSERIVSRKMMVGTTRKIVMLLLVAAAFMMDRVIMSHGVTTNYLIYKWSVSWYIAVETLSIYENATRLGIPLPPALTKAVEWLLERSQSASPLGGAGPTHKEKKA